MSLEIFQQLAEPIDPARIKTRYQKDKKSGTSTAIHYIDARTVIDRLNSVCPGMWTFETELLAMPQGGEGKWVFKGRLTVCGAWQEDVGMNDNEDYFDPPKSAVSDALKRCAVHFGIGAELYGDAPKQSKGNSGDRPQQKTAPKAPEKHAPASQGETTHIPSGARLCDLEGAQLYAIQTGGPAKFNMHPKRFENTWKKEFDVRALKDITVTMDEFVKRMNKHANPEKPETPTLDEHFGKRNGIDHKLTQMMAESELQPEDEFTQELFGTDHSSAYEGMVSGG